jgi:hypothetical protein
MPGLTLESSSSFEGLISFLLTFLLGILLDFLELFFPPTSFLVPVKILELVDITIV